MAHAAAGALFAAGAVHGETRALKRVKRAGMHASICPRHWRNKAAAVIGDPAKDARSLALLSVRASVCRASECVVGVGKNAGPGGGQKASSQERQGRRKGLEKQGRRM